MPLLLSATSGAAVQTTHYRTCCRPGTQLAAMRARFRLGFISRHPASSDATILVGDRPVWMANKKVRRTRSIHCPPGSTSIGECPPLRLPKTGLLSLLAIALSRIVHRLPPFRPTLTKRGKTGVERYKRPQARLSCRTSLSNHTTWSWLSRQPTPSAKL